MQKTISQQLRFEQLAELVKEGYKPTGVDGLLYIGLEHINQQSLSLNSIGSSSDITSNKFAFKAGDILFGKLRPYFRKVYRPSFGGVCSTDIWVVRAKEGVDQGYLFYLMANPEFVELASSGSSGTRMPRADWNHLRDTTWSVPSLLTQRKIAKILGDLDAKIELNQQMNKTLEAMAQALFKEWFVDFRFPGYEKVKFVDGLPEGWQEKTIAERGQVICGKTPPTADKENYGGDISFITIPDMRGNPFVIKTERCISFKGASTQKNKELPPYSICVSCIATPGLVSMTSKVSHTNQQINSIIPNKDISPFFVYCALLNKSEDIKTMGLGGTATLNLNTGDFARIKIAVPTDIILNKFHTTVAPLFETVLVNAKESLHLCFIRDSLLPKLMSGKIRGETYAN